MALTSPQSAFARAPGRPEYADMQVHPRPGRLGRNDAARPEEAPRHASSTSFVSTGRCIAVPCLLMLKKRRPIKSDAIT